MDRCHGLLGMAEKLPKEVGISSPASGDSLTKVVRCGKILGLSDF